MKQLPVLILSLLIQSTWQESNEDEFVDERNVLPTLLNILNDAVRGYEKYVLRNDEVYWKLASEADPEYDFIVVGGGSSGCVIASRLSEIKRWKVLLLEAGDPEDVLVDIPLLVVGVQNTSYDWAYKTEKLTDAGLGLVDQRMNFPRGKALGGCSVLNFMMYIRGNRWDYDSWAAQGNPGWSYQEVLPYFLKSEGARLENADSRYHNTKGYLSVEESYKSTLTETFLQGGEEMGLPSIDYNSPTKSFGLSSMQSTLRNGRRESVARAFLYPASNRTNLHILTGAFVRKILINGGTAYGVTYEKGGKMYTVTAKKEVIVSAGTVNTPQLLMLSGLGPKSHLEELGIRCLKDLSVGRNLQDHLIFPGVVYSIPFDGDQTITRLTGSFLDYVHSGTGLFTMLGGVTGLGFVKTEVSKVKEDQPDIEFMFVQGSLASGFGNFIKSMLGMKEEFYDETFLPLEGGYQWTIAPVLLHPKSIGSIELRSRNPHDQPLIKPDYFSDPENEDIRTMIAGIREIQKLTNTTAFKIRGADLNELAVPGCADFAFDSDGYWECSLRSMAYTIYHPIGTAKMGPRYDRTAVVNHRLQVYGIKNLRVADCSVIPSHISGHTNAAAVMIGEKASDYIKESWGRW